MVTDIVKKFNPGDYVQSRTYKGISMVVIGNTKEMIEIECDHLVEDLYEDRDYYGPCYECESYYEEPEYRVLDDLYDCVMVGDDQVHSIDIADLTLLDSNEFCIECGQIGCSVSTLDN